MTPEPEKSTGVLDDVRRALGRTATVIPDRLEPWVVTAATPDRDSILEKFIHEVQAVRGSVQVVAKSQLPPTILGIQGDTPGEIAVSGSPLLRELGLSAHLAANGLTVFDTAGVDHEELIPRLEGAAAGITAVDYALAETGTLAISSEEANGLLVSLLPPVHIAVVERSQIFASLDEVIDRLGQRLIDGTPAGSVSFITGPSRTSDVELVLSIGVHGPKELHVIVVE